MAETTARKPKSQSLVAQDPRKVWSATALGRHLDIPTRMVRAAAGKAGLAFERVGSRDVCDREAAIAIERQYREIDPAGVFQGRKKAPAAARARDATPRKSRRRRFAGRLRAARERADLTQAELGDRIGQAQSRISKWEQGDAIPEPAEMLSLAQALGVTLESLCGEESETPAD